MANNLVPTGKDALDALRAARASETAHSGAALLCDTSGSMLAIDTQDGRRRIDHLADVLGDVLSSVKPQAMAAFDSVVTDIPVDDPALPHPEGGTRMVPALEWVEGLAKRPTKVILLSDGQPNDLHEDIFAVARRLGLKIDTIFCGDDQDIIGIGFMRELARLTGGTYEFLRLVETKKLAQAITTLLLTHGK